METEKISCFMCKHIIVCVHYNKVRSLVSDLSVDLSSDGSSIKNKLERNIITSLAESCACFSKFDILKKD